MSPNARQLLLQVHPDDAEAAFRAGATAIKQGLAEDAIPIMAAAARAHPQDARIWQILGLAYRQVEDLALAVEALGRAAELAPADALIAHGFARAMLEAGLPASALFERAHGLAPQDASILLGRAAALFAEGRAVDAIGGLDEQLTRNPGWLQGHVTVARLRWMCDEANFTSSFERALRDAPREATIWRQLIATLMDARFYDQALAAIGGARAAAGEHRIFDEAEASCRAERGETEEADRLFARLGQAQDLHVIEGHVRHLIRSARFVEAAALAQSHLSRPDGHMMWPYLAVAWRLTADARSEWLEGDPRFIGVYDIGDGVGSLEALADRLRGLHLATRQPLEQSLRGGTQTDGPLFSRIEPEIRALREAILACVRTHIAQLPPPDRAHPLLSPARTPIRFSGSWSVRLVDRGHHANHVHSAGWISSAFYVSLPEESMGKGDHSGWLTLGEASELGVELQPLKLIEPKAGRLVLFPSTMWHGTRPFEAGERLTVAFDVARQHL